MPARGSVMDDDATLIERVVDPLMLASHYSRPFFERLPATARAVVVLYVLHVQIHRNGLLFFIEDEPAWLVRATPWACDTLGEAKLGAMFRAIEPYFEARADGQLRAPSPDVMEELGDPIQQLVTRERPSLEERLFTRLRAELDALRGIVDEAEGVRRDYREGLRRRAEEDARQRAAMWASLRPEAGPYSPRSRFAQGDALTHVKFGLGRVLAVEPGDKVRVQFEDGAERMLVHGR